jgi:hypothetical protein
VLFSSGALIGYALGLVSARMPPTQSKQIASATPLEPSHAMRQRTRRPICPAASKTEVAISKARRNRVLPLLLSALPARKYGDHGSGAARPPLC